jgi:pimeloyl-ACP methyl ester carboxylesterase
MTWEELPPVYARLGGFLAGSLARRLDDAVPRPLSAIAQVVTLPARLLTPLVPAPLRDGAEAGWHGHGADEPPVLIVPGFMGPSILLAPLAFFLRAHGRRVHLLRTFPALGGVEAHARRVADAVAELRAETGAERVDYVAHSMGGLAARYYIRHLGGDRTLRRVVTIATPHRGTNWGLLRITRSGRDMAPDSPFIAALGAEETIEGIRCTNIRAGWDQMVWPRELGRWGDHARDHELPFAEHWAIQADPRALALVLAALEAPEDESPLDSPLVGPEVEAAG